MDVIWDPEFNIEWMYLTLANLSSAITDIQFHITSDFRSLDGVDWDRIDNTLEYRRYPCLRRVMMEFELFGTMLPEMATSVIENLSQLRLCHRGLLQFSF